MQNVFFSDCSHWRANLFFQHYLSVPALPHITHSSIAPKGSVKKVRRNLIAIDSFWVSHIQFQQSHTALYILPTFCTTLHLALLSSDLSRTCYQLPKKVHPSVYFSTYPLIIRTAVNRHFPPISSSNLDGFSFLLPITRADWPLFSTDAWGDLNTGHRQT